MRIFLKKRCKNYFSVEGSSPEPLFASGDWRVEAPPPDLRVVTPVYYYNFVEFVSYATCVLLPYKKNKIT